MLNKNFRMIHSVGYVTYYTSPGVCYTYLPSSTDDYPYCREIIAPSGKRLTMDGSSSTENIGNTSYQKLNSYMLPIDKVTASDADPVWSSNIISSLKNFIVNVDGANTFCSDQPEQITTTDYIKTLTNSYRPALMILGSGTTPATENDYKLENCNLNYKLNNCVSSFDTQAGKLTVTLCITANEDGDVSEIGLYTVPQCGANNTSYQRTFLSASTAVICLVGRKVLDTPIHIQAGKTYNFSYTVDFMLMSDSQ